MATYDSTDRVRASLQCAREEAERLGHDYVGTEHILLALLRDDVVVKLISALGAEPTKLRAAIEFGVTPRSARVVGTDLPFTGPAKVVLELAMREARELDDSQVGTEHLFLGLVREDYGVAAQALAQSGIRIDAARAEAVPG